MTTKHIAINVEKLSKCYRIGLQETIQDNFFYTIGNFINNPLKNFQKYRALYNFDDVSLDQDHDPADVTLLF